MSTKIIASLVGLLLLAGCGLYIYMLKNDITQLEADKVLLELSNESLKNEREKLNAYISSSSQTLERCLDNKIQVMQDFEEISNKYNNVKVVDIDTSKGVLPYELRQELRQDLVKPLPTFDN